MSSFDTLDEGEKEHYRMEGAKLKELIKEKYQADFKGISEQRVKDGLSEKVAEWDGHNWHTGQADTENFDVDSPEAVDKFAEILHRAGKGANEYYDSLTVYTPN